MSRDQRFKVFSPASIAWGGSERRAHLINVSAKGASLHCRDAPEIGQRVSIACGSLSMSGAVRWSDGKGRFGVEFTYPLADRLLAELRRIGSGGG